MATTGPMNLKCEYFQNPLGIDEIKPRLSWQLNDPGQGARQTAYQVQAASDLELLLSKPDLWDSGTIRTDQSLDIVYTGRKPVSRQLVLWRVRTWDQSKVVTEWSEPASFEFGLLKKSDWKGQWIGRTIEDRRSSQPCQYLRREFTLKTGVKRARIYVTARGVFELNLNGKKLGNDFFAPGWTDYRFRIPYLVYDISDVLKLGQNAIGAMLADGWYAGHLTWSDVPFTYGEQPSLLLQLVVEYSDGTNEVVATGPDWKTSLGPITRASLYHGETYDARLEMPGWDSPDFADSDWLPAAVFAAPDAAIVAKRNLPVRKHEELATIGQTEPSFGTHVFDLGQNMVGWARIKVRARSGDIIRIRYGEILNTDGTLHTANLRMAQATDYYICRGGGEETYEPRFTFHGFRYVELTGLCEKPSPGDVTGVVLHSDIPRTGQFECSDPLINRLQQNIVWGQKGNFLEVPTDCPQRDERLGWTGDAQVFVRTACFNRDVSAFFTKWCIDMEDAQMPNGQYPHVVPDVIRDGKSCAAWADAGIICPWTIYLCYGDTAILRRQYKSMTRWIEWQRKHSKQLVLNNSCFGDWLAIDIAENDPGRSPTPRDLISTAYFAFTTAIVAKTAKILGNADDARKYAKLATDIKTAFNREFVSETGRVVGDTQTGYLLALGFSLLSGKKETHAFEWLVADIEKRGWHLSTGFVGTPLLAPVLGRFGRNDVAYKLLTQKTYPSWLCQVLNDATTMWERWNGYTKEQGLHPSTMNSLNHYAYGAIGEWMYAAIAGIDLDPLEPGYKHIIVRPQPGGGLSWARGELETRYGTVRSEWKIENGRFKAEIRIPPNTRATITLPGSKPKVVLAGTYKFDLPAGRTPAPQV
jgi:alpha-L-rhamnosidase